MGCVSERPVPCVASVSSRVRRESCRDGSEKKRNDGEEVGNFFFCSRSNFRAITRLETFATRAKRPAAHTRQKVTKAAQQPHPPGPRSKTRRLKLHRSSYKLATEKPRYYFAFCHLFKWARDQTKGENGKQNSFSTPEFTPLTLRVSCGKLTAHAPLYKSKRFHQQ